MEFLSKEQKEKLYNFAKFVRETLEIKDPPQIAIQNGRGKLRTTANYDYDAKDKVIHVNAKNRMLVDVMRSISHEMVHHKQYEQGRLKVKPPDIGGEIEDEANAKSGQFIKLYAKKDPTIYDD